MGVEDWGDAGKTKTSPCFNFLIFTPNSLKIIPVLLVGKKHTLKIKLIKALRTSSLNGLPKGTQGLCGGSEAPIYLMKSCPSELLHCH